MFWSKGIRRHFAELEILSDAAGDYGDAEGRIGGWCRWHSADSDADVGNGGGLSRGGSIYVCGEKWIYSVWESKWSTW